MVAPGELGLGARARRRGRRRARTRPPPPYAAAEASLRAAAAFPHGRPSLRTRYGAALDWPGAVRELAPRPDRQHPAGAARPARSTCRTGDGPARAGQGRVPQPRRLGEGPDRHPDDRGRRGVRRAPARRHHRRADVGQHRRRAGDGRPGARATSASSSAPTRSARTSATCSRRTAPRWSSARPRSRPEHPDSYYNVSDRLASQPGAWKPDQYSNPNNPRSPLRDHRPGDLGADRRAGSPTSSPASAPAARSAASAATSRSRTPTSR